MKKWYYLFICLSIVCGCSTPSDVMSPALDFGGSAKSPAGIQNNEPPLNVELENYPAPESVEHAKRTIIRLLTRNRYGSANYDQVFVDNTSLRYEEKVGGIGNFRRTIPFLEIKSLEMRQIPDAIIGRKYSLDIELYHVDNLARLFVDSKRELKMLFNAIETMMSFASQLNDV